MYINITPFRRWLRGPGLVAILTLGWLMSSAIPAAAKKKPEEKAEVTAATLLENAQNLYRRGDKSGALSLINKAAKLEPENYRPLFARARWYSAQGETLKAVADFDDVLLKDPTQTDVYQLRGIEHFRLGHVADSLADFNRYLTLNPSQIPYHWQRGISYYYMDRFKEGRQQFELHQGVNPQDVENAAWHFFCVARQDGVEKARVLLLPVTQDSRSPMMQIHALLAGQGTPEEVLAAAAQGNPSPAMLQSQLFYAHLYLGLYFEVLKDEKQSREHIAKAVDLAGKDDYMGTVAKVHAKLRKISGKGK